MKKKEEHYHDFKKRKGIGIDDIRYKTKKESGGEEKKKERKKKKKK